MLDSVWVIWLQDCCICVKLWVFGLNILVVGLSVGFLASGFCLLCPVWGFWFEHFGCWIQFWVSWLQDFGFCVQCLGFRVQDFGFGAKFRVWGFSF